MVEVVEAKYGPWYARIQLIDGKYCVLILADKVNTFLVKDRPQLRLFDTKKASELLPWKFDTLRQAVRFGKRELRRWKRQEKRAVKKHIREEAFTEMRIYR